MAESNETRHPSKDLDEQFQGSLNEFRRAARRAKAVTHIIPGTEPEPDAPGPLDTPTTKIPTSERK